MTKRVEDHSLSTLYQFLNQRTPAKWLDYACNHIDLLLIDHAHCERKAASTALILMGKYPNNQKLIQFMSPLAREELLHFEKVIQILNTRQIEYYALKPCSYAKELHSLVTSEGGPLKLRDELIVGAMIEARSCERFQSLVEVLNDDGLKRFYRGLVKSELRHFENYLELAHEICSSTTERIKCFIEKENELILRKDKFFRFHSGIPNLTEA
tara:strand:+ start:424 stop:1059 length:636 start_codon:yes stop_codon:yes gene_type:complete